MIIALHGFTGSPAMWESIGERGPVLLGHGDDAIAHGGETFASEVERLASALPAAPVHLVGYSLGARLSLAIALRCPQRVSRLSLIGVSPGLALESEQAERVASDASWSALLREHGIEAFVDRWQALPLWDSQRALPAATRAALRQQRLAHDPEQLARAMDALGTGRMPPMWDALGSLAMPVQIIAGELDRKYILIARRMCETLSQGRLRVVAGAGHNPVIEQPQAVRNVINETS